MVATRMPQNGLVPSSRWTIVTRKRTSNSCKPMPPKDAVVRRCGSINGARECSKRNWGSADAGGAKAVPYSAAEWRGFPKVSIAQQIMQIPLNIEQRDAPVLSHSTASFFLIDNSCIRMDFYVLFLNGFSSIIWSTQYWCRFAWSLYNHFCDTLGERKFSSCHL